MIFRVDGRLLEDPQNGLLIDSITSDIRVSDSQIHVRHGFAYHHFGSGVSFPGSYSTCLGFV